MLNYKSITENVGLSFYKFGKDLSKYNSKPSVLKRKDHASLKESKESHMGRLEGNKGKEELI